MQKGFNGIFLVPFFVLSLHLGAQVNSVSPYSRLGIGDIYPETYTRTLSLGGASLGMHDALNINLTNPASYSALELSTFEVGFQAGKVEQRQANPDITRTNGNAGLRYLAFGVPLTEWWGSAIGIQPYSFKGYDIATSRTYNDSLDIDYRFGGTGGLNQFYWGNSFEVAKGLSLGFNTRFIFGKLEEVSYVLWNTNRFFNTKSEEEISVKGVAFDYGLQYRYDFENNKSLGIGLTYSNSMSLNAQVGNFAYNFTGSVGRETPFDSLATSGTRESSIQLPSEFGIGLTYGGIDPQILNYSWAINMDFEFFNGSEFQNYDDSKPLSNSYRAQLGGYLIPRFAFKNLNRSSSYLTAVEYRLGGFYEKTPYTLGGTDIMNYGITFGLGLPVRQKSLGPGEVKVSTINTGIVLGRRGTTANGLIEENYLNVYIGITLNDKWFIKYKYR
ncbi:MAG TPA: hypothetical protein DDW81_05580 [Cryomorphaceae bacterium]|nr:hypothetical protein [Owenweeksia sp.]HBF19548.1 hypothetical protein [Cryomorphaceae bacterium]HCQ16025.1 hypothetical protein [Cryomorphaceae bacterium]|tara:strand:+ start:11795 stop:13123 length:1329 start_codon:yes stop_codon:yes gene_type:complete